MSYYAQVEEDARVLITEYWAAYVQDGGYSHRGDSFVEHLDSDGRLHEHIECIFYSYDAEEIIDNSDNVEEDYGLWEGITDWRKIREIQAFYTLSNDIRITLDELVKGR